jgi:D-alanyl-lipoteichoic acid acyltransferase DltB (MBOAT superfamily)
MKPWRSFLDFALFVSFFPQLVAGPIVRARDFLPQCSEPRRATSRQLAWGMTLLVMGMFMKIVLADACLARVADRAFGAPAQVGTVDAWLGTFAFSCQIFYDFAGYSTCAIGVALCLGFKLPDNFRAPFAAVGFSDFWRRWHISLSTWLRDYVYIPLGGNRLGRARTYVNIMLTMLIGGLWHGASWSFVAWGGLHGAFLVIERIVRSATGFRIAEERKILRLAMAGLTFVVVSITWVFFRSQDLAEALELLKSMLVPRSAAFDFTGNRVLVAIVGGGIVVATFVGHWLMRNMSLSVLVERLPWWLRSAAIAGMILAIALAPGDDRAFIYFQF